jgi:hypothetical protein
MRTHPTWLILLLPAVTFLGCGDKDDTEDTYIEGDTDTDTDADSDTDADADADTDADTDTQPPEPVLESCSLDRPGEVEFAPGQDSNMIYGLVSVPEYTEVTTGVTAVIDGELGYGLLDSDPSADPGAWTWMVAGYTNDSGDYDEYAAQINVETAGVWAYAFRFSVDEGGSWTYCDLAGSSATDPYDPAEQGVATVGRDDDGDGYLSEEDGFDDCDDGNASINPGAVDTPLDEIDQDCDGEDALPSIDDLVAGDLVITEVHPDSGAVSDQYGEWFEVYNASGAVVDLLGLLVYDDGTETFELTDSLVVDAEGIVVFGRNGDVSLNGGVTVDYTYSGFVLANTSDAIYLDNGAEILDEVVYESDWPFDPGVAMALDPSTWDSLGNDDLEAWCAATTAYGDGDLGTPGDENLDCPPADIDLDGDGYDDVAWGGDDCDDGDAAVNPGAVELCDSVDNDCDGTVDVGATDASDWYEDGDGDGYGDATGTPVTDCTMPSTGYVGDNTDCDDTDAGINPGAEDIADDGIDQDCDGVDATDIVDDDGDGFASDVDCDDTDAAINPDATELCDGVDNDCDGTVDGPASADVTTWYRDGDGDGYGDSALTMAACTAPTGYVATDTDCDDRDATIYPGAPDSPGDGIDSDCDGTDGPATDADGDGYDDTAFGGTDCDDGDATIYPGATETCGDGIDQDCDGSDLVCSTTMAVADLAVGDLVISEFMPNPAVVTDSVGEWFEIYNAAGADVDLEGMVVSDNAATFTVVGSLVLADGDYLVFGLEDDTSLNDNLPVDYVYTGPALANTADQLTLNNGSFDIDQVVYDGAWPVDAGYAVQLDPAFLNATDNDDVASWCHADAMYGASNYGSPGVANSACATVTDADGDGYDDTAFGGTDCDDSDASVNPGAVEICDSVDNDCDGTVDGRLAVDAATWYLDDDADGYGDAGFSRADCTAPAGYVADDTDCDDTDASVNPGAVEICGDGIDQDCSGADEVCSAAIPVTDLLYGDLVITEFQANPYIVADGDAEWFEVYNNSGFLVDLDGLVVYDLGTDSFTVSGTLEVADGDFLVFGINDDTTLNDGVPVDYVYSGYSLANSSDEIVLSNGSIDIDEIIYDGTWPVSAGYAAQLDPASTDASSNDDPANWCLGAAMYGASNAGTPGVANDGCAVTPTDVDGDGYDDTAYGGTDCDDGDSSINPGATEVCGDGIDQDCDGSDLACASIAIEWCNVQWLGGTSAVYAIATGDSVDTFGQVFVTGVTDSSGQGAGIDAQVGYGISGTDPSADPTAWAWVDASYNTDVGYNDEYGVAITPTDPEYYGVAYRFSGDSGATWTYCDAGGTSASSGDVYTPSSEWSLTVGTDADGDGHFDIASGGMDCDDSDASIYPGATDPSGDGIDQDCDGGDGTAVVFAVTDLAVGDLVITEFHANPAVVADADGEWFEVYNASGVDVDLEGLVVYDLGSDSFTVTGSLVVLAGEMVVFGTNADTSTNDGVPVDYEYGSAMYLSNTSDELVLSNGVVDLDDVIWDGTWGVSSGYALQVSPGAMDATSNDDVANWCAATTMYGASNYGTPGDFNVSCGSSSFTYTHDADLQPIWDATCTSCHSGSSASASLDLSDGYTEAVDVPAVQLPTMDRVEPGDTSLSYLWHKLEGTQATVGGSGNTMPRTGTLSVADRAIIETWITEGAPK